MKVYITTTPDTFVLEVYHKLVTSFSDKLRIINLIELIKLVLDIDDWLIFEPMLCQNGNFDNYLMDKQIDFSKGKELDLSEIYESILTFGDFTESEKDLFELAEIEKIIWGIYLAVLDPINKNNI